MLGAYVSAFKVWLGTVEPGSWFLIILGIILILSLAICFGLIIKNWAKGALIAGVQMALRESEVDLKNTSPQGLTSLKNLVIYDLMITGMTLAVVIVFPSFWLLIYFFVRSFALIKTIWITLGIIIGILIFIILLIVFSVVGVYAERLIVLKGYKPWQAWKVGLSLGRKGLLGTVVMGIINQAFRVSQFFRVLRYKVASFCRGWQIWTVDLAIPHSKSKLFFMF